MPPGPVRMPPAPVRRCGAVRIREVTRREVSVLSDFKKFVLRGNVVDLAVAIVVGVAFTAMITAFVADLVTPLIAAIFGKPNFGGLYVTVNHSQFKYGLFLNALLSFLIIATVVFFAVVVPLTALMKRLNLVPKEQPKPETRECPECLSDIPVGARRCAFCTSEVATAA
jgi:large conductance mechanosensitive channel